MKTNSIPFFFRDREIGDDSNESSEFAKRLKFLRKRKGDSQERMSRELSLGNCTYGTYENDRYLPDAKTIRDLAKYFNVSADYLLGLIDEPNHADTELPLVSGLFEECKDAMQDISFCSEAVNSIFKGFIQNPSFITFLQYIDTYLIYSAKIPNKTKQRRKESDLSKIFNRIFKIDLSPWSINYETPIDGIDVADMFLNVIHEQMNNMIKKIAEDNKDYYIKKNEKCIDNVAEDIAAQIESGKLSFSSLIEDKK